MRAGRDGAALMQVNIVNPLPNTEYSYELTRTDGGALFGGGALTISGDGEIGAETEITLLAPHERHAITAQVRVFSDGEEITDTIAVVVRPRDFVLGDFVRYSHITPSDGAGVLVGEARADGGEGGDGYEYSINSPFFPLAIDENGVIRATAALSEVFDANIVPLFSPITVSVRLGDESMERVANVIAFREEISFSVSPDSVVITTGATGVNVAAVSLVLPEALTSIPVLRLDTDHENYRFTVINSANLGFRGRLNLAGQGLDLVVISPFTAAQAAAEFEIVAEHTLAMRRLTVTVTVQVVAPTEEAAADIETDMWTTAQAAQAEDGGGGYTFSPGERRAAQIATNPAAGKIGYISAFLPPPGYRIKAKKAEIIARRPPVSASLLQ